MKRTLSCPPNTQTKSALERPRHAMEDHLLDDDDDDDDDDDEDEDGDEEVEKEKEEISSGEK
jgi:hypothetical protein